MNKKQVLILFLLCLIPFFIYLINPYLIGADNYHFFNFTCNKTPLDLSTPILSYVFFNLLPCNLIFYKLIGFLLMFISLFIISKTGELHNAGFGWIAGPLSFLAPGLIFYFASLEDDMLIFPLWCLSIYFLTKKDYFKSFFVLLLGFLFWKGTPVLLLTWSAGFILIFLFLMLFLFFSGLWIKIFNVLVLNFNVQENLPLIGLNQILYLLFGSAGLSGKHKGMAIFLLVLGLVNRKFIIYLVPLLAFGFIKLLELIKELKTNNEIGQFIQKNLIKTSFVFITLFLIVSSVFLVIGFPHKNQLNAVKYAVEKNKELDKNYYGMGFNINNDWSWGYYIEFFDGVPERKAGPTDFQQLPGINLTEIDLNCVLLKNFGKGIYSDLKVYACNESKDIQDYLGYKIKKEKN